MFYDVKETYDISLNSPYTSVLSPVTYSKSESLKEKFGATNLKGGMY